MRLVDRYLARLDREAEISRRVLGLLGVPVPSVYGPSADDRSF
jgi:hypothetical protein